MNNPNVPTTQSRFDYVQYDKKAAEDQALIKQKYMELEQLIEERVHNTTARGRIFVKLEESYMWVGKAIRDDQNERNGGTSELQEQREAS